MARVAQIDWTAAGECDAMASIAGRQDAVEHVDAALDRLQQILRRTNSHQVARPLDRQMRHGPLDQGKHHGLRLTDRKSADGIAVKAYIDDTARARPP